MNDTRITDWHLGHILRDAASGKVTTWDMGGEPVDPGLVDEHQKHANFLLALLTDSPYAALEKCYDEFKHAMAALRSPDSKSGTLPRQVRETRSRLDNLLSALRAFTDRTAHDLKERYGENSDPVSTFKESLSCEYDNEFAYRFMYKLRNYSQHCGQPDLSAKAQGGRTENGEVVRTVSVTFDPVVLLSRFNKWGAHVKGELQAMGGEFEAEPIVDSLMASCGRAYSKTLLTQEGHIQAASTFIHGHNRAPHGKAAVPCFFGLNREEWISNGRRNTTVLVVRIDLAILADSALAAAKEVTTESTEGE
ncbi:hypothetical protein [Streptomyces tailanensis]|uniref:hypothetical protein n=1 Tax=Streptomyces tailanensis TaxID=2569858 RepID=UPI00122E4439|nr:hypothetical protein [Streptomyces tailanensis]